MNYKINSVLCKKYFRGEGINFYAEFFENNFYNKFILEDDDIGKISIPYNYKYIYIYSKKGGHRFHLDKNCNENYMPNFYDYFYDDKELRKLKIKKFITT